MKRQDFRFFHRLRVRWAEVDVQKIVFNSHYLMYLDTALSDYWRAMALPYQSTLQGLGGDLYLKKAALEYHASAACEDMLDIGFRNAGIGNSSLQFVAGVFRGEQLLVSGEMVHVFADPATQSPRPVPQALRAVFAAFEAGEPMVKLEAGDWARLGDASGRVRTAVFVEEQQIRREMVWDQDDEAAIHAVAFNRLGVPVASGRLLLLEGGVAKLGRMAVDRVLRGSRLGLQVLELLTEQARQRGCRELMLHAQSSAEGFYRRQGYQSRGEAFEEVGIRHIEMMRPLR
jgi:YbgC/YbaW family acyl-CoA thioester hydrolase